ncbi:MAG: VOC family protein [Bacteroidota bacterium]
MQKGFRPYLIFKGNCKQALHFYAEIFKGEITKTRTYKDSPLDVDDDLKGRIFDMEMQSELLTIGASDDLPSYPVTIGSNISLFITLETRAEAQDYFNLLSEKGQVLMNFNDGFAMVKDQFGIHWMILGLA